VGSARAGRPAGREAFATSIGLRDHPGQIPLHGRDPDFLIVAAQIEEVCVPRRVAESEERHSHEPGGEGKPNRDSGRAPGDPALQLSRRQVLPYDPGQDSAHPRDEEGPQHGDFSPSAICG